MKLRRRELDGAAQLAIVAAVALAIALAAKAFVVSALLLTAVVAFVRIGWGSILVFAGALLVVAPFLVAAGADGTAEAFAALALYVAAIALVILVVEERKRFGGTH